MGQRKWIVDREFEVDGVQFVLGEEFPTSRLKKEIREYLVDRKCIHAEGGEEPEEPVPDELPEAEPKPEPAAKKLWAFGSQEVTSNG